jgi:galactosylceramidase
VFSVLLEPNCIYSISTTRGQQKGGAGEIPADVPFPLPYRDDFKHYADAKQFGYLPHYTADICGVFEIGERPDGKGKCLEQVLDAKAQSWAPEWIPYTVLGDSNWRDYEVSADIFLTDGGWAGVMGRVNSTGNGWDGDSAGYYARLYADGGCALYLADQNIRGARQHELALGSVEHWRRNRWHRVMLRIEGVKISVLVDGSVVCGAEDRTFANGMAGLIAAGEGNDRHRVMFDDVIVNRVKGPTPAPTIFPQDGAPIYP